MRTNDSYWCKNSLYITLLDEITLNINDDMLDAMLDECQIQDDTFDKFLDELDDEVMDVLKDCNNEDFSSITKEKLESKLPDIKNWKLHHLQYKSKTKLPE